MDVAKRPAPTCAIDGFALECSPVRSPIDILRKRVRLGFLLFSLLWPCGALPADEPAVAIAIDWSKVERISQTSATLQVVVNPLLRRGSPIHDPAWNALRALAADHVRFVPWYPYPKLGVAELAPPANGKAFWDFSLIDPLVIDFFRATADHPAVLNFSTIPQWMFKTASPVEFPTDPNESAWNYEQGTQLRDSSGQEVAAYYARILSWYTCGGFLDELGQRHDSPHRYKISWWEILNEPEYEHAISAKTYTTLYDAIANAIHQVSPETKFIGMSLAEPMNSPAFFEYFLNPKNHQPGIPLDSISYHFYAVPTADQAPEIQPFTVFEQADKFLTAVQYIESIRQRLSPSTKTDVNETGCILPEDIGQSPRDAATTIPASYWNLCAATFAYLYAGLARQGVDIVGASQLLGYPSQFPSVTMLDWNTGQPNARYWALKLILENFHPRDRLVQTKSDSPYIFAQGFFAPDGTRKLLLVNKRDRSFDLSISGAGGASLQCVDQITAANPPESSSLTSPTMTLRGLSVAVLTFPPSN
jgi:hypothetical protein